MKFDRSSVKTLKGTELLLRFQVRQISQIREGGLPVLLNKVAVLLMMAPAALVLLVATMARPLILIRFGIINSARIGQFAREPDCYLSQREAGTSDRRNLDIFFFNASACNLQLKKMWDRTLLISPLAKWPYILAEKVPGFKTHLATIDVQKGAPALAEHTTQQISFTTEEDEIGQAALRQMGIPEGAPFICVLARDSAYLDFHIPTSGGYSARDSSIHSYVPAVEELTLRGYYALRMGAIVKEPLNTTNPMIVDYATKHRTDFMDIYLGAKCRFFLGDTCGYTNIPIMFRRPLAVMNCIFLADLYLWSPKFLFLLKKLWLRKENRFMTFRELLDPGVGRVHRNTEFERLGIEVVDNTPEEIAAVAVEMDERLRGTWRTTEEDEELQRRFSSLVKSSGLHSVVLSRVGAEFLRENQNLLS